MGRAIQDIVRRGQQAHFIGSNVAGLSEELQHQVGTPHVGVDRGQLAEQLGCHSVGSLYFLAYRSSGALNFSRNQDDHKGGAESGHHEVQTRPQSHLAHGTRALTTAAGRAAGSGGGARRDLGWMPAAGCLGDLMKIMSKVS